MKRFKEPLKTLLILLLTASAVFMAVRGGFFGAFYPEKPQASAVPTAAPEGYPAAALPAEAAVTAAGGHRCGVKYDAGALVELLLHQLKAARVLLSEGKIDGLVILGDREILKWPEQAAAVRGFLEAR